MSGALWLLRCVSCPAGGSFTRPSYSPDGKNIVFESDRMGYCGYLDVRQRWIQLLSADCPPRNIGNCPVVSEWPLHFL